MPLARRARVLGVCACTALGACTSSTEPALLAVDVRPAEYAAVGQWEGVTLERQFTVHNDEQAPVVLEARRASWGCTVLGLPSEPLPAGADAILTLRCETDGDVRTQRREAHLAAITPQREKELVLALSGAVRPLIVTAPEILHLGEVPLGQEKTLFIEVGPAPGSTAVPTGLTLDDPRFRLDVLPPSPRGHLQANLTLLAQGAAARIEAPLRIALSGTAGTGVSRIIRAIVNTDLRHATNIFLERRNQTFLPRDLPVTSRTGRRVRLLSAVDPAGVLRVTVVDPETPHGLLRAEVAAPQRTYAPAVTGHLDVKTSNPAEPVLRIDYVVAEAASH